jgi:hypothetical protein
MKNIRRSKQIYREILRIYSEIWDEKYREIHGRYTQRDRKILDER